MGLFVLVPAVLFPVLCHIALGGAMGQLVTLESVAIVVALPVVLAVLTQPRAARCALRALIVSLAALTAEERQAATRFYGRVARLADVFAVIVSIAAMAALGWHIHAPGRMGFWLATAIGGNVAALVLSVLFGQVMEGRLGGGGRPVVGEDYLLLPRREIALLAQGVSGILTFLFLARVLSTVADPGGLPSRIGQTLAIFLAGVVGVVTLRRPLVPGRSWSRVWRSLAETALVFRLTLVFIVISLTEVFWALVHTNA